MNETVERVQLAICKAADRANDKQLSWSQLAAVAAIEAMKEPTEAMLHAGAIHSIVTDVCWKVMIEAALKDG